MVKIQRFGMIRLSGLIGLLGVLIGIILVLIISLSTAYSLFNPETQTLLRSVALPGLSFFITPLVYGVVGFVGGFILIFFVNLFLKIVGGADVEIQELDSSDLEI